MRLFQKLGSAILLALTSAAAAGALLALVGRYSPTLDALSHIAPIYAILGIVGLAIALAMRPWWRRAILGASAVALACSGMLMAPEGLRSTGPTADVGAPGAIKVIQFNALRSNIDFRRVADWLIAEQPDVVTVSETDHGLRDLLVRRTGWKMAGAHSNLIIFTRERYERMDRPEVSGSELTYVNATYAHSGGPMEIATTHLDWPNRADAPKQVPVLKSVIARLARDRMILTGDFNATPWSRRLQDLDQSLGLIRRDRAVATFPAQILGRRWPLPFLAIDHVYAGPGWATVSVKRGPWLGSDHYPLVVVLAPVARP